MQPLPKGVFRLILSFANKWQLRSVNSYWKWSVEETYRFARNDIKRINTVRLLELYLNQYSDNLNENLEHMKNAEMLFLLIKKGADDWNKIAVISADNGYLDIFKMAVEKDCIFINDNFANTCYHGRYNIVEYILSDKDKWSYLRMDIALVNACHKSDNMRIINLLIENGAQNFSFALRNVCYRGMAEYVEFLIEKGANNLNEALRFACMQNRREVNKILIEKGATECVCELPLEEHI